MFWDKRPWDNCPTPVVVDVDVEVEDVVVDGVVVADVGDVVVEDVALEDDGEVDVFAPHFRRLFS